MEFIGFWLLCAIVVAVIASSRGRSGLGWFLLACVISPLLALILVLALGSLKTDPAAPNPSTHVRCPDCREPVLMEARKCKHCGAALVPQQAPPQAARGIDMRAVGIVALVALVMAGLAGLLAAAGS